MFDIVYRNKLYYSSYLFLKKSVERDLVIKRKKVFKVLDTIHPSVYIHDDELDKFINKRSQLDYAVGLRRFFLNDFVTATKKLRSVPKNSSMYVEANYLLGLINIRNRKIKSAKKHFYRCIKFSKYKKKTRIKPQSYILSFRNRCIQQLGRLEYTEKDYKTALKVYNFVKKEDYLWPRFLMDKSWAYYMNGENERALGSVISFKAPLLSRFMIPEANYLRALVYYDMCYYEKSEQIYNEFNEVTWKYRNTAKTASRNILLKLLISKKEPINEREKFLYYYLKGYKKDIRYLTFKESRRQIRLEIKKLSRIRSLKQARVFLDTLYGYSSIIKEDFQDFLKNLSTDYYEQIKGMRSAFVKLNLMISLKKRKKIMKENSDKFEDDFFEQSLSNIADIEEKFIWDFRGGFWADELGDYAVALKNRCGQ